MQVVENTECVGIWTEYLVCKIVGIDFISTRTYVKDLNFPLQQELSKKLEFLKNIGICEHIGGENSSIGDFKLADGAYLSVKTNISGDKVCPNFIGQTTLKKLNFSTTDDFKYWVLNSPEEAYLKYSQALLKTKHLLYINYSTGNFFYITNQQELPKLSSFTFTKNLDTWKESCTMKIDGKSIAEFQVHNNRNCVKCRFSMKNFIQNSTLYKTGTFTKTNFKIKKKVGTFNYLGSKTKLLHFIRKSIEEYIKRPISEISSFFDLFAGSGAVSSYFLENKVKNIITNDNMYYSKVLCAGMICDEDVSSYITTLNQLEPKAGHITKTYATNRMYFTEDNAKRIDAIREYLADNKEIIGCKKFYILLRCLLYAATKVANISSTYGAYLKKFKTSSLKQLNLVCPEVKTEETALTTYNQPILQLIKDIDIIGDVCYLDPPYNSRKYSSNYFVMEVLASNCKTLVSDGITGIPLTEPQGSSDFCSKTTVVESFDLLFKKIKTKHIFVSYSSESLVTKECITDLLNVNGWTDVKIYSQSYQRFKSNSRTSNDATLFEYLFCAKRA